MCYQAAGNKCPFLWHISLLGLLELDALFIGENDIIIQSGDPKSTCKRSGLEEGWERKERGSLASRLHRTQTWRTERAGDLFNTVSIKRELMKELGFLWVTWGLNLQDCCDCVLLVCVCNSHGSSREEMTRQCWITAQSLMKKPFTKAGLINSARAGAVAL